jgi:hypothetical protein
MKKFHEVGRIEFIGRLMLVEIDGRMEEYDLNNVSPTLASASELERMTYEISPSGYGIHWPLIDEDISVDSLLGIVHWPEYHPAQTQQSESLIAAQR